MKKLAIVLTSALLLSVGNLNAAGNADAGKTKAAACAACHGADGNSMVPTFPKLAGQHEEYTIKQLSELKSGVRKDPVMGPMAMGLSEQDQADLGAYFSSQKTKIGSVSGEYAAGEKIYRGGIKEKGVAACMACHGPDGSGNPAAKFPSVRGQHADYVKKQLMDFRTGTRSNDLNGMMRDVATSLTDQEIADVAKYITALH